MTTTAVSKDNQFIYSYLEKHIAEPHVPVAFADFFEAELEQIIENTDSKDHENIDSIWSARFGSVAKTLGLKVIPKQQRPVNLGKLVKILAAKKTVSVSAATSAKSNSHELTPEAKAEFTAKFKAMKNESKWELREGVYVEDIMYEFGMACTHEHPAHSFILSVEDECWEKVFKDDFSQIADFGNVDLPGLPDNIQEMLKNYESIYEQEDPLDFMITTTMSLGPFDLRTEYDLWWLHHTIEHFCSYYQYAALANISSWSEMDFATKIWGILDDTFMDLGVVAGRDRTCLATSKRMNHGRGVTGASSIKAKVRSTRPDLVILKNNIEYGCSELGKIDDPASTPKEIVESELLCPKTLKDMVCAAAQQVGNDESVTRALKVICFNQTALRMKLSVMDCPSGYVCRIVESEEYEVPTDPRMVFTQLLSILKLTLQAKYIVENSLNTVDQYRAKPKSNLPRLKLRNATDKLILPACLTATLIQTTTSRKRKSTGDTASSSS